MAHRSSAPEMVVSGISFPEGLAWSVEEQLLYCSGVQEACVHRVNPVGPTCQLLADLGGGANNVILATGGGCLVAQNGGLDSNPGLQAAFPEATAGPEIRPRTPGLVHVMADGAARYVVDAGLNAPNDLAVAADGTLYLTDPGNPFLQTRLPARVVALSPNGRMRTLAEDFAYCNGIATGDGELFVTDHGGVIRIGFDGAREWAVKFEGGVDGLALDVDGRLYVCGQADGIIRVFDGAAQVDELRVGSRACVTNCCFGGPELRDLYVTDALAGAVLVFTGMPSPGRPVLSRATSG